MRGLCTFSFLFKRFGILAEENAPEFSWEIEFYPTNCMLLWALNRGSSTRFLSIIGALLIRVRNRSLISLMCASAEENESVLKSDYFSVFS